MHGSAAAARVHISADDDTLTGFAGLLLPGELVRRTGLVPAIDVAVNAVSPFKRRLRGCGAGELLVSLAEAMVAGADHLAHLEVLRQDQAGASLRAVANTPPPTTAGQLLRRLTPAQCRAAVAAVAAAGNRVDDDLGLDATAAVTLDIDASLTEVYGRTKEDAVFNYEGRRGYNSQFVTWAERNRVLAAELYSGNGSAKPSATRLFDEALGALPENHGEVSARGDSDYCCVDMMHHCRRRKVRFAFSVPRNSAMWNASFRIPVDGWRPAIDMHNAEIAETTYAPGDWKHEPLRLIIRRVRIDVDELSRSSRARRRRTVPRLQLALSLNGSVDYVYGYSFILSDIPGEATDVELWQRRRANIEERIKDAKLGCGLFHLPLGTMRANRAWQVSTVIALNLVAMLSAVMLSTLQATPAGAEQEDTSLSSVEEDDLDGEPSHRLTKTVRRWMIAVPGRIARTGRRVHLHLPRGWLWADRIIAVYERLRLIPAT